MIGLRRGRRGLRALLCVLMIAALLLGAAACAKSVRDRETEAEEKGAERVKDEVGKVLTGVEKGVGGLTDLLSLDRLEGDLDMTISLELADGNYRGVDLNDYLRDSSIGLKVDCKRDRVGLEGDVTVVGERFLSGKLIYDDGVLGFQVPELDSTYYTIDLEAVLSQSYEGRQMLEALERMEDMGELDIPADQLMEVLSRYIDLFAETVNKDNLKTESATFTFEKLPGGQQKGKVHVFTPSAEDVEGLLERLADELEDDKELRELIVDFADQVMEAAGTGYGKSEMKKELDEGIGSLVKEMRQNAEEAGEAVEDSGFRCAVYTAGEGVWKAEASVEDRGDTYRFCAEMSDNGLAIWAEDDSVTPFAFVARYEKTGSGYTGAVTLTVEGDSVELAFENVTDRISALGIPHGHYTLTLPENYGQIYLDVTKSGSGTDHVLRVDIPQLSQYCAWEGIPDLNGAKLTVHTADQSVTVSTPTGPSRSLDSLDSYEMQEVFGAWEDKLEQLVYDLADRLGVVEVTLAPAPDHDWGY